MKASTLLLVAAWASDATSAFTRVQVFKKAWGIRHHSSVLVSATYFGNQEDPVVGTRVISSSNKMPQDAPFGSPGGAMARSRKVAEQPFDALEDFDSVIVQGGSLRTWSFNAPDVDRVQVMMRTQGRPLNANVELWHGPDSTPQKVGVYLEDGSVRSFNVVIAMPRDHNSVAVYNTGQMEFPVLAGVEAEIAGDGGISVSGTDIRRLSENKRSTKLVQGGAVHTIPFSSAVESVAILLKSHGRPLNARIELLQGPNNNKQVMEVYSEDGLLRPFYFVIDTPGLGNVLRIVNTATMEFPVLASVEPCIVLGHEPDGYVSEYDRGWDESANTFHFLDS